MKSFLTAICSLGVAYQVSAQGLVKFSNNSSTLITLWNAYGPVGLMPPSDVSLFYFALLTAPLGTTDPTAFTFAGIYATNSAATTGGRLQGGSNLGVGVLGWATGTSRSFEVAGWSASMGATWNPAWLTVGPLGPGAWGLSEIGQGMAGGTDTNGASIPAMPVFGPAPWISRGFVLDPGPEPSTIALAGLGALMVFGRSQKSRLRNGK